MFGSGLCMEVLGDLGNTGWIVFWDWEVRGDG